MPPHKILVIGFGTVGQGFFDLFQERKEALGLEDYVAISEVIDAKFGYIQNPGQDIVDQIKNGRTFEKRDVIKTIRESDADIVCEFTWVNIKDGEPAFSHMREALSAGKHVVTTNKGPIALHYEKLQDFASKTGAHLRFKGTVMSGTPSFDVLELLPGIQVQKIRGIFNGTTNFILTEMVQSNKSFDEGLSAAQSMGYAEADPTLDVDGFDSALKTIIFSKVIGWRKHNLNSMQIKGIRDFSLYPEHQDGKDTRVKLLASADAESASVRPVTLTSDDLLFSVNGAINAVEITTDTLGKIFIAGPGAGKRETAQAALSDLVWIIDKVKTKNDFRER